MSKINFKTIILKGLFFLVSLFAVISTIAVVTYFILGSKLEFGEYMILYYKFFLEFIALALMIGLMVGLSIYGIKKIYDKLFNNKTPLN